MLKRPSYSTTMFVVYSLRTTLLLILGYSRFPEKVPNVLSPVCFTPELVLKHIKKLKANSSGGGPDGLPASFFKVPQIPLLYHYRLYLTYHCSLVLFRIFGNMLLLSQYSRIKGSPAYSDPCNCRPISSLYTCISCKLMEAGIKDTLLVYTMKHKIINAIVSMVSWPENRPLYALILECTLDWNTATMEFILHI